MDNRLAKNKRSHVLIANFNGNYNVGLYIYASDKYCIIGPDVPEKFVPKIGEALNVKVIQMTIAGTSLPGVFLAGNSKCLLVPSIIMQHEIEILKKNKIKHVIINTKNTCLGNNIICNDKGCLISVEYGEREIKQIKDALSVPVEKSKIAKHNTLGSLAVHGNSSLLCHHQILENEAAVLNKVLKTNISTGTVNMGSPFVGAGIVANKFGFVIGDASGGPEIINADEALGFLDDKKKGKK